MIETENPRLKIELVSASLEQKTVLANLLELYTHDFCDFLNLEIGVDGRFGYQDLDLYWIDPDRLPFLIYAGGKLAGFSLVHGCGYDEEARWDMVEFFVMRGLRRHSVGMRAALEVFSRLRGRWQVRVMQVNPPACAFWGRAVHAFAGDAVRLSHASANGREWNVYSFHSPARE